MENTNATYIIISAQDGQIPTVSTHATMEKATKEFKRVLRDETYYGTMVSLQVINPTTGKGEKVQGWTVSYGDGEFFNCDTSVSVDFREHPKGEPFDLRKMAPLFPKA